MIGKLLIVKGCIWFGDGLKLAQCHVSRKRLVTCGAEKTVRAIAANEAKYLLASVKLN